MVTFDIGKPSVEPRPDGPQCTTAPPVRRPTADEGGGVEPTLWQPDRCANVMFGEIVLRGYHKRLFGIEKRDPFPDDLEVGFSYPCSMWLIRAVEWDRPTMLDPVDGRKGPDVREPRHIEACRIHLGRYAVMPDGFERTVFCSLPTLDSTYHGGIGIGMTFVRREADMWPVGLDDFIEDGFEYDFAAYETPVTKEVSLNSALPTCGVWV